MHDDLQKAVEYRGNEIKYDSTDIEGHDQLAMDLSALGENREAIEVMRRWVEAQSSLAPERRDKAGNLHALFGKLYFSAGNYAGAVREYEQALAFESDAQIKTRSRRGKTKTSSHTLALANSPGHLSVCYSRRFFYDFRSMANRVTKTAVFPGQFDPITKGHLDVIHRGVGLFDRLIVAVGNNPEKTELFTLSQRVSMIRALLKNTPGIRVEKYTGLTVDFVKQSGAVVILRGIRDVSDLRHEFQLALANRTVGGVETVFIMTGDQYALTSSSLIRQVVSLGGDIHQLRGVLPGLVIQRLRALKG